MAEPIYSIAPERWRSFELYERLIQTVEDPLVIKDLQHRWVVCNAAFAKLMGVAHNAIIGHTDSDYFPADQVKVFWEGDDLVASTGQMIKQEEQLSRADGTVQTVWTRKFPLRDDSGEIIGTAIMLTDITEIRQRREQIEQLERELAEKSDLTERQSRLLEQLGAPVVQIWNGILLLPLIGPIDGRRATRVMEHMLEAISQYAAEFVIMDITGVPMVDTAVASYLITTVQASQLLGCQCIVVGISAEIAQTMVQLGINFSAIATRATLQSGLEYALSKLSQ